MYVWNHRLYVESMIQYYVVYHRTWLVTTLKDQHKVLTIRSYCQLCYQYCNILLLLLLLLLRVLVVFSSMKLYYLFLMLGSCTFIIVSILIPKGFNNNKNYPGVCTIQECVLSRSVYYPGVCTVQENLLAKFESII